MNDGTQKAIHISFCSQYVSSIYLDSLNNRTLAIRPSKLLPHGRHFATLLSIHLLGRCKGTCHEIHDQHVNMELFPKCLHTATPGNNLYLKHTNAYTSSTSAKPIIFFSLSNLTKDYEN